MLFFAKTRANAVIPNKRDEDAAYDIFPCYDEGEIVLPPLTTTAVQTGIASAFDKHHVVILKERSSFAKRGVSLLGGVIDSGYRGEWLVMLTNNNTYPITVQSSNAVAQALYLELGDEAPVEIEYDELKEIASQRGTGGFGSTDVA